MHDKNAAFSLIQLSGIVLAAGLVAAAVIPEGGGASRAERYLTTFEHMKKVDEAFYYTMLAEGRRPCPASGEYYPGHAKWGKEDGSAGNCEDSGATDGLLTPFNDTNVVAGTVPVHSLGIPDKYYFDGFGRPLTYVVDKRTTLNTDCVQIAGSGDVKWFPTDGGTQKGSTMYGLISHGPDGHGAFQPGGSTRANRMDAGSADQDQHNNTGSSGATVDPPNFNPATFANEWIKKVTTTTYDDFTHYSGRYKNTCCLGKACRKAFAMLPEPTLGAVVLYGHTSQDRNGTAVAAGDINNDGIDDFITSSYQADPSGRSNAGEIYVVFGKASGWSSPIDPTTFDGTNGVTIIGTAGGQYGFDLDTGDFNGDGITDILIGSFSAGAYVVFGKSAGWTATFDLTTVNGTNGFALNGVSSSDRPGNRVSSGNINGDTNGANPIDDVIVSAPFASPNGTSSGSTYVIFGKTTGWTSAFDLTTVNGTNGFRTNGGAAYDGAGYDVSAGDLTGDGFDELVIGASNAAHPSTSQKTGLTYVLFGKATGWSGTPVELSTLTNPDGFTLRGTLSNGKFGAKAEVANVNNDSFNDIIVSSYNENPNGSGSGQTHVVFGKSTGWASSIEMSSLTSPNGSQLNGEANSDNSGIALGTGDINGNGVNDVIIGAPQHNANGISNTGRVYVVFGNDPTWSSVIELSSVDGTNGFALNGVALDDYAGEASVASGDFNDDGYDDVVIGAWRADPDGESLAGETYIIFGKASGWSASENISDLLSP